MQPLMAARHHFSHGPADPSSNRSTRRRMSALSRSDSRSITTADHVLNALGIQADFVCSRSETSVASLPLGPHLLRSRLPSTRDKSNTRLMKLLVIPVSPTRGQSGAATVTQCWRRNTRPAEHLRADADARSQVCLAGGVLRALRAYRRSSSGATSIEYGLITMVIAVACIGAWQAVGAQSRMNMRCIEQTMRFSEKSGLC